MDPPSNISAQKETPLRISRFVVFGLFPEFLGQKPEWYAKREHELSTNPLNVPLLREKTVTIEADTRSSLPELLRRLDELGYEKVLNIGRFGEFAHRGGIVDIFPINVDSPIRIEFLGNTVELIEPLDIKSDLPKNEWEKIIKKTIEKPLDTLTSGDYLVHLDHGIGRFKEERTLTILGEERDYFAIEYAKGDMLYVPHKLAQRKLTRYVGLSVPSIHRLGGTAWLKTKKRVREDVRKFAEELLALYAKRSLASRPPLTTEHISIEQFISSFPYKETADQIRAWEDIVFDLSSNKPMDRLLAGDVGFGKTEIALRAAVLVAANGKQVAILAPTTVLAHQHARISHERLNDVGVRSALLTRLVSGSKQKQTLVGLKNGEIDIVIGTHRLLSNDVNFKRLGLIIIDEEQRFGVKQKEKFKKMRTALDVLSLSATPIPRTLAQSLTNIRPVSRLQIAPRGRQEIATHFGRWDKDIVRDALIFEKHRGGQSYVLHNRVSTIHSFTQELRQIIPELSYGIVHGRMGEVGLLDVMDKLQNGEIDVLVATTIIENGLDLANVNTLIVEETGKLGLGQTYQLRGRIGRGSVKGYAYLFWKYEPEGKAALRIDALRNSTALGSGWELAMHDLEIRGAGNLLGRDQSGSLNRVGFNLYAQLLAEAVETLRQGPKTNKDNLD